MRWGISVFWSLDTHKQVGKSVDKVTTWLGRDGTCESSMCVRVSKQRNWQTLTNHEMFFSFASFLSSFLFYLSLWKLTSEHSKYLLLGASRDAALTTCVGALWMVAHCFPQHSLVDSTGSCVRLYLLILGTASPSSRELFFFFYCNYLFVIEAENVDPCLSEHDSWLRVMFTWPCAHQPKLSGTA